MKIYLLLIVTYFIRFYLIYFTLLVMKYVQLFNKHQYEEHEYIQIELKTKKILSTKFIHENILVCLFVCIYDRILAFANIYQSDFQREFTNVCICILT